MCAVQHPFSGLGLLGWGNSLTGWDRSPAHHILHPRPQAPNQKFTRMNFYSSFKTFPGKEVPRVEPPSFLSRFPTLIPPSLPPKPQGDGGGVESPVSLLECHSRPQDLESELGMGGGLDDTRAGRSTGPPGGSPGARPTAEGLWAWSVRVSWVFGSLQLHLQPLHTNLKAVHGLDGRLRAGRVVKAHES